MAEDFVVFNGEMAPLSHIIDMQPRQQHSAKKLTEFISSTSSFQMAREIWKLVIERHPGEKSHLIH